MDIHLLQVCIHSSSRRLQWTCVRQCSMSITVTDSVIQWMSGLAHWCVFLQGVTKSVLYGTRGTNETRLWLHRQILVCRISWLLILVLSQDLLTIRKKQKHRTSALGSHRQIQTQRVAAPALCLHIGSCIGWKQNGRPPLLFRLNKAHLFYCLYSD